MSQKLPVNGFKWINDVTERDEKFIKNYDEDSDKEYILEVDFKNPRKLHDLHGDLPFLPKRMEIDKCENLVCNLHNKKKIRWTHKVIKTSTKSRTKIEKIYRIIEFNQEV